MANYQEARVKLKNTQQIKICSEKQDRNSIKNKLGKNSRWRIATWFISNNKTNS